MAKRAAREEEEIGRWAKRTYKVCILSPSSNASSGGGNKYGRFLKNGLGAGAGENTVEGIL